MKMSKIREMIDSIANDDFGAKIFSKKSVAGLEQS
jgi:hypothetical protein